LADSLLITGPPASGKSRAALDRFLSAPGSLFFPPSATMAEHVRNELARAGHTVRPHGITTLAHFLDGRSSPATPVALLHKLIEEALDRLRPDRFRAVAEFRGFRECLAALIEEVPPDAAGAELASVFEFVERELRGRGMALRRDRLMQAAADPGDLPGHVVLDGFFSFSPEELRLIASFARRATVTVTLPDWAGATGARSRLISFGFAEQKLDRVFRRAQITAFSAPTMERETEEIARRILDESARGRPFREVGVIVRSRDPYVPALETTFARFGIPARFYFADSLIEHPVIGFLAGVVRTMLDGWDHAALLTLLRMPVSGIGATPAGDRFDFELRRRIPGAGLPIPGLENAPGVLDSMAAISEWRNDRIGGAAWAARLKTLRTVLPEPAITGSESRAQIDILRSTAAALEGFEAAIDQSAEALGEGPTTLSDFCRQVDLTLSVEPLRVLDRRRNVVHVMDVFEARQWELPVMFVCGLVERNFPRYHGEDPLLNDAARSRVGLRTSAERQNEERFLFELAVTRATHQTILSYARFNEKGEDAIPSLFLPEGQAESCEVRVRPRPRYPVSAAASASIHDAELLTSLGKIHRNIATTSIEQFLQCPFQFFAAKSLRLRPVPAAPRDRLDVLLQGSILHRALAELIRMPLLGAAVFDEVFAEECRRARVPATYRTEAVRLEMMRNFEAFIADRQIALGWSSRVEEAFNLPLNPLMAITGRIDRIDIGARNQALVIDYKYSAGQKIRERIEETAAGNLVQGGLYLLAAERCFGIKPVGMLYCGLRKDVVWDGWHLQIAGLEGIGETRATLKDLAEAAATTATEVFDAIASGRIAPEPADENKCGWCDFRDICRIESAARARTAAAR